MRYDLRLTIPAVVLWVTGCIAILAQQNLTAPGLVVLCTFSIAYFLLRTKRSSATFSPCHPELDSGSIEHNTPKWILVSSTRMTREAHITTKNAHLTTKKVRIITSQIIFCALLIIIQSTSLALQNQANFPENIVGQKTNDQIVQIKSSPNVGERFGQTTCTYQVEGFKPHGYYSLRTTGQIDPDCMLDFNAKYQIDGKYSEDDFHLKNAATLQANSLDLTEPAPWLDQVFNQIHRDFLAVVRDLPGNAPALVPGMSIGDTRYMTTELSDATKVSSLTHLTAISGSHFVIIISVIGILLGLLRLNKKVLAGLQICSVLLLTELVHPTDSVKRAAIMSVIGLFSIFLGRRAVSLSALSAVVAGWMIFDPYLACSIGFALSAAATFSIIVFSAPLTRKLTPFLGKTFAALVSVPIVAQVGCTPILLLMTDYLSPLGPFANLLVVPVIEPATILSLVACLCAPVVPAISAFIASISGWFTEHVANVAAFTAGLPSAKVGWTSGAVGSVQIVILTVIITVLPVIYRILYIRAFKVAPSQVTSLPNRFEARRVGVVQKFAKRSKQLTRKVTKMSRKARIGLVLIFVGIIASLSILAYFLIKVLTLGGGASVEIPPNWLIAACPVGQGDAAAIKVDEDNAVVVDTGPKVPAETDGKPLTECLKTLQVKNVSLLTISHFHDDHIGGVKSLLENYHVDKALLPAYKGPPAGYGEVTKLLEKYNVAYTFAKNGDTGKWGCVPNEVVCTSFQVLSALDYPLSSDESSSSTKKATAATEDDHENNSSVNLLFNIRGLTYWTAGDLETDGDKAALTAAKASDVKDVDVLKVNHHGSKTQNATLDKLLNPAVALFMVGKNTYGHPAEKTQQEFTDMGATLLRTDQDKICGVYYDENNQLMVWRN